MAFVSIFILHWFQYRFLSHERRVTPCLARLWSCGCVKELVTACTSRDEKMGVLRMGPGMSKMISLHVGILQDRSGTRNITQHCHVIFIYFPAMPSMHGTRFGTTLERVCSPLNLAESSQNPAISGFLGLRRKKRGIFWMKRGTCWGRVLDDGWIDVRCLR